MNISSSIELSSCVKSTAVAARHPRSWDLGFISHAVSQRYIVELEQNPFR